MIKYVVLSISVMVVFSGSIAAQSVSGAWRLDEVKATGADGETVRFSQPNIYLFTKAHFSIIRIEGDKPRSTDNWTTMTREQLIDTFIKEFTASGGTYEMNDGKLTMKTTIAKSPGFMARSNWITYSVEVTGQTMKLTGTATNEGPIKNPQTMTLTRIE